MSGDVSVRMYYSDAPIQLCDSGVDLTVYAFVDTTQNAPGQLVMNDVLGWLHNMFGVDPLLEKLIIKIVWPVRDEYG